MTTSDLTPKQSRVSQVIAGTLLFVILGVGLYFLLVSPYFMITQPTVVGATQLSQDKVMESVKSELDGRDAFIVPKNHLAFISSNHLESMLKTEYPIIETVKVEKSLPNLLRVVIEEKEPVALWQSNNQRYLVDSTGHALKRIGLDEDAPDLPRIVNTASGKDVSEGEYIVHIEAVEKVVLIERELASKIGVEPTTYQMPTGFALEITATTSEGWKIIFARDRSVQSQLDSLQVMLRDEIDEKRSFLKYVDLRIENVGYFR